MKKNILAYCILGMVLVLALPPTARANAPELVVTEPGEEDQWSGTENVVWVTRDNEGGPATFTVSYSYDGGVTWIELAVLADNLYGSWTEYRYAFNTVAQDDATSARIKVECVDNEDNSVSAQSDVFEILNRLSPPTPTYPADGSSIKQTNPTLEWRAASAPTTIENYTLQLATVESFTTTIYTTTTQLAEVTVERYLNDGWYYWRVRAYDNRGALSGWSDVSSFEVYTRPPIITSFSVNSGAVYTSDPTVRLDLTQVNATHLSFSSNEIDWSEWSPYSSEVDFYLTGEDGQKWVYVRGKDVTGRMSDIRVTEIILDTSPPTSSANLSGFASSLGYKGSVAISFVSSDSLSGVDKIYYRVNGDEWRTGSSFVIAQDGHHEIEYYAIDLAGNSEQIQSHAVEVYTPVTPFPYYTILGIIAVSVAGLFVGYKKLMPRWRDWRRSRFLASKWMHGLFTLPEDEEGE